MLRCNEVAELVASDAWRGPPLTRRVGVLLHLMMCRYCRAYVRQLRRIGAAARQLYRDVALDSETAARLSAVLREAARQAPPPSPADPQ